METLWFVIVALMIAVYVVLDGFDLGAGIIHHLVAHTEAERTRVLRAIGPVWDGNEVWLLAVGGTLFFSFPVLYATSFSGFYLPLMMVLWLLIVRGIGIELRGHVNNPLWRQFWDFGFAAASALLAVFFGAALGNVVRGVPLNAEKIFFEPLWTNFRPHGETGILDWYTVLTGVIALVALAAHGANYIALKTTDEVQQRSRRVGRLAGWLFMVLAALGVIATLRVRPQMFDNYRAHIWSWLIPLLAVAGFVGMDFFRARGRDLGAFLSSAAAIVGMLGGAAFGLYPTVLPSTLSADYNLTIWNTATQSYGLRVGLIWWSIGMALALVYFTYLYRSFRGKVPLEGEGY